MDLPRQSPASARRPRLPLGVGPARRVSFLGDFAWERGAVRVRKTGARILLDGALLRDILIWSVFYVVLAALSMAGLFGRAGPRMAFLPDRPRPWYLVRVALMAAGGRVVPDPARADLVMQFEDAVEGWHAPPRAVPPAALLNFGAGDIRKSQVAAAFEQAFGYPLSLDPATGEGLAVEKSEGNGVHDGRCISRPCPPRPGFVYQRFIDTQAEDGLVEDLRTPTVAGRPVAVFIKRRRPEARFSNDNVACVLRCPEEVFSPEETAAIGRFCALLGLDWGGLDILRDRADDRLYIVDANKTDMGPPIALSLRDKLRAVRALGAALRALAASRRSMI